MNRLIFIIFYCQVLYKTLLADNQDTLGTMTDHLIQFKLTCEICLDFSNFFLGLPCQSTTVDAYLRTQQHKQCSQCDIRYTADGPPKKVTVGKVPFIENICAGRTNPEQLVSIEIACDVEISVVVRTPDTTVRMLPKSVLGTSYILSNPSSNIGGKTQAIITATRDNTSTSYGSAPIVLGRAESFAVQLDPRDTTSVLQINADKAFAVLFVEVVPSASGNRYSFTAIPPKSRLGVNYVLQDGYSYSISGIYNSTNCSTSEGQDLLLGDTAYRITDLDESTQLECNEPVIVNSKGQTEMHVVPATTMYANNYRLNNPGNREELMLKLYVERRHVTRELTFNGLPITSLNYTLIALNNSSYVIIQYQLESSQPHYSISHKNPTARFYVEMRTAEGLMIDQPVIQQTLTGSYCKPSSMKHNDYLDNDCDYRIDEELLNGIDDDGDGRIDEDVATNKYYSDLRGEPERFWKKSYTVFLIVMSVILTIIILGLLHWKIANWNPEIEGLGTDQDTMISQASTLTVPRQGYRLSGSWSGFTVSRTG